MSDLKDILSRQAAARKEAHARDARIHQTPVSKSERDARIAARAKPVIEQHLTPGGAVERTVRQKLDAENERRINFIEKRLERQKGKAQGRFNMAR